MVGGGGKDRPSFCLFRRCLFPKVRVVRVVRVVREVRVRSRSLGVGSTFNFGCGSRASPAPASAPAPFALPLPFPFPFPLFHCKISHYDLTAPSSTPVRYPDRRPSRSRAIRIRGDAPAPMRDISRSKLAQEPFSRGRHPLPLPLALYSSLLLPCPPGAQQLYAV